VYYNSSDVKIYYDTSSLVRFWTQKYILRLCKKALTYYNAGIVIVVNSEAVGLAPEVAAQKMSSSKIFLQHYIHTYELNLHLFNTYIHAGLPGVDVMITIFCDFCHFSVKKFAFFSKTNVMIKFLQNLAIVEHKNANIFANLFAKNIF
jgi:hypothetical protein